MTTSTAPTALPPSELFAAQKIDGTGSVHVVRSIRGPGMVVTFCTGRAMSWMVSTDAAVTCKACLKKAGANGIDVRELAS